MTHLDWSGGGHWSSRSGRCLHCGGFTRLTDDTGSYAHKVCAETAADQPATDNVGRFPTTFDLGRTA